MFKCAICGARHYKGSTPAEWCHSVDNPDYVRHLLMRHKQGFHTEGNGGHHHCPSCINPKPTQLTLSI